MKLTVIVPAFNEQDTIGAILKKLIRIKEVEEIIVVNDCSRDKTIQEVKKVKDKRIRLFNHTRNLGKGAAIRTGLKEATGDYVLIQDADLEYDPADIPAMLDPVLNQRTTVVFGSRFLGPHSNMFFWHMIANKLLNLMINVMYDAILSDMETCYKLIPTDLLRSIDIRENDFRIEPEITCKLLMRRAKIMEVPISYVARTYEEGKKIGWRDAFKAVWTILKLRVSSS
jgi:glycosyltransferase involved in cell wall biosynthesis